jgi:NO-binding membrane sensor protein with MHYT domain
MEITVAFVSLAFAALGIWLTVRIVNRRERWARRMLAALLVGLGNKWNVDQRGRDE